MSFSPPFPCPYSACAPSSIQEGIIVAANTRMVPEPLGPDTPDAVLQLDGLWGVHEWTRFAQPYDVSAPYLAYIHVPFASTSASARHIPEVLCCDISKTMWEYDLGKKTSVPTPALQKKLADAWDWANTMTSKEFPRVRASEDLQHIAIPQTARERAFDSWILLTTVGSRSFQDFVVRFRHFQRGLLELHAFDIWLNGARGGKIQRIIPAGLVTRGVLVRELSLFRELAATGCAVYMFTTPGEWRFDPDKLVELTPRSIRCRVGAPWLEQTTRHSRPHWFYPPRVNSWSDFESAARGYTPRLDQFNPTDHFKGMINSRVGSRQLQSKKVSPPNGNNEWRRAMNTAKPPSYMRAPVDIYTMAQIPVNTNSMPAISTSRKFRVPPTYLFWGCEPKNQRIFYFHVLILQRSLMARLERHEEGLSTKEWRLVLGDHYWISHWKKVARPDGELLPPPYEPLEFLRFGGPLFFGTADDAVVANWRAVVSPLDCGCPVTLDAADDEEMRYAILFSLNMCTLQDDIEQMIKVFPIPEAGMTQLKELRARKLSTAVSTLTSFPNHRGKSLWELDWGQRRPFVDALREVVRYWKGYEKDWPGTGRLEDVIIEKLDESGFLRMERLSLLFYIQSIINTLGYPPAPFLPSPVDRRFLCRIHRSEAVAATRT